MSEALDTDLLLVNRDGTSYQQEIDTMRDRIDDTDLLLVYRGNQAYKITGRDFIDSTQDYAPPVLTNAVLAEDSPGPGGTRFANQNFNVTYNMLSDGTPDSSKFVKPYVVGGISLFGQTSAITNVFNGVYSTGTITGSPSATTGGFEWLDTFNPPGGNPNNSIGALSNASGWDSYKLTFTTPITGSVIQVLLTNNSSTDWGYNGVQVNNSSTNNTPTLWTNGLNYITTLTATTLSSISTSSSVGISAVIVDGTVLIDGSGIVLTLTNDQDLNLFDVNDTVEINGQDGGVTGTLPTNAYVGNSGTYTNQAAQWGLVLQATPIYIDQQTQPWIYFGGGSSNPSTFTFTGSAAIMLYCTEYNTAGSLTISGDARFENSATTIAVPSGIDGDAIGSVKIVPTSSGGNFVLTADTWVYTFGLTGNNAITMTAKSTSTPSMTVDYGVWSVGDYAKNTVERQEQVIVETSAITNAASTVLTLTDDTNLASFTNGTAIKESPGGGIDVQAQPAVITMGTGTWADMVKYFPTTPVVNMTTGNYCYAGSVGAALTMTFSGSDTITIYGSTGSSVPSGSCAVTGNVTETSIIFPSGTEGSASTPMTLTPSGNGGSFTITMTGTQPLFMGFQGALTSTVVSTNSSSNQMTVADAGWTVGSKVATVNTVPNPAVKMFCVTNSSGSITDLSQTDPGYTGMATTSTTQTLTFPATFPSGVAADTELPVGTTLAVDVKASNMIGTATATTNVVTPTT